MNWPNMGNSKVTSLFMISARDMRKLLTTLLLGNGSPCAALRGTYNPAAKTTGLHILVNIMKQKDM